MAEEYKSLLSGSFELAGLPDVPSKLIRVYLACTPTDTVQERNALVERVYPGLREYTREKYGLEFQVVDLRWGVPAEQWVDGGTDHALCFQEVETCKKISVGPSFVGLVGQRYGDRPLPSSISESDFELIRATLRHHRNRETRDVWLLDHFYKKDTNAVPPVYLLQSIENVRENLKPKTAVDRLIIGDKEPEWSDARAALRRLLQRGVEYCLLEGSMVESDACDYLLSDLEKEFRQGILFALDPQTSCHVFHRTIVDLKNYVNHPLASKFMEITYNERERKLQVDEEADSKLDSLLSEKLVKWLGSNNISEFSVLWKHDLGIHPELHQGYLDEFCATFDHELRSIIDSTAQAQMSEPLPPIVDEVFQHWLAVKNVDVGFTGRQEVLDIMKSYTMSNDRKPLVLFGDSGCGKTSLIAKAAAEMCQWMPGEVITIVRFLGLTAASFDLRQILFNICVQLATVLDRDILSIPNSFKDINNYFVDLLSSFPDNKNLVILLDSLHMLVPQYNAHFLNWLPTDLNENVKVIVTTLPDTHGLLSRLKTDIIKDENNFVEVPPFTARESRDLLKSLLSAEQRCLSQDQMEAVLTAFKNCSYPLYIRLVMTDARRWSSMSRVDVSSLPSSIKEYINSIFDKLEKAHGKVFVSNSLAYLTASTTGLSDLEMEDVLSLDDEVLREVYQNQPEHTIRRIPPIVWQRVKYELRDFLMHKDCEGVTVSYWTLRLFIETAKARYLQDDAHRKSIHSGLADYMLGTWHGVKKPFTGLSHGVDNENKREEELADRLVPSQPLTFQGCGNVIRFNKRKYDQVPRHLYLSGRLDELNDLVLFSYSWLYNKTKALSLEHILADFVLNPGVEATLVERALRDAQPLIAQNVDNMAAEISGRLLAYYTTHPNIRKLIHECDTLGLKQCALIPNFPYYQVPGSPLKYSIECKGMPTSFSMTAGDSRYIFVKELSSPDIQMYDLATGEKAAEVVASIGEMHLTPDSSTIALVDHTTQKTIKVHDSISGQYIGQLIPQNQIQIKPKEKYSLGKMCLSDTHLCLVVTSEKSYLCVARLDSCKFTHVRGMENRATVCEMTHDSRYVYCNADKELFGYDVETMQEVNKTQLEHRPNFLIFNQEGTRGYMISEEENKIFVLTLRDGVVDFMYKIVLVDSFHEDCISHLRLSNNQELLLGRGESNIIVYNVSSERVCCHFTHPAEVPTEFKLPKSHYQGIHFTQADFSPDDKFVIASIFRNVYIWHVANNRLLTTLQAPVGIIADLFVPCDRGQIVTHLEGSNVLHVWSLGDAIGHVGTLDRLTNAISDIQFASDDAMSFVKCEDSDEVGVLDMSTGQLIDLLTHESLVNSFSVTPSGDYVFVSLKSARPGAYNKLWHTSGRKIIHEFGNCPAYSVAMADSECIIAIFQDTPAFKAPYKILQFKLKDGCHEEMTYDSPVNFVLSEPFMTPEDRYLVILSAASYDEKNAFYKNPTICAISMRCNSPMNTFSADDLKDCVRIRRILHIRPYATSSYTVVVLYTNEPDNPDYKSYDHCYGFMIFDVCSGVVCHVVEEFLTPSTPIDQVLFTGDAQLCIDNQSNVFDMHNGYFLRVIYEDHCRPRCLALGGKMVVYFEGEQLFVVRLSNGECIARVNVHGEITRVAVCKDQRTLVAGCRDGSLVSYVLIDESQDVAQEILNATASRKSPLKEASEKLMIRSWDKIDNQGGPPYSRPPSALMSGPPEKELLRQVQPASLSRPGSDTLLYQNSRACILM